MMASCVCMLQWRSQDIADTRAQHGHNTFVQNSALSPEAFRVVWGMLSQHTVSIYTKLVILWIYVVILGRSISGDAYLHWRSTASSC